MGWHGRFMAGASVDRTCWAQLPSLKVESRLLDGGQVEAIALESLQCADPWGVDEGLTQRTHPKRAHQVVVEYERD